MATTIGLPSLTIGFEAAAEVVANRSKRGTVAVIVRDTKAHGVYLLSSDTLIPSALGTANKDYIKTAFEGSDRGKPRLVIAVVISTTDATALADGLKLIEQYSIDYLAGPPDVSDAELTELNTWVKAQRALYRTVKLVRPFKTTSSNDMGIIEFDEAEMQVNGTASESATYCARIAGILAGIPSGMSSTYVALPEVTKVTPRTTTEQNAAIKAGKLILIHDGLQAKIARGVNSLTVTPSKGKADWCKIKIVEGMDLISYYLRTTIENSYIGQYPNTYDNKQLLVSAISTFLKELEAQGVLSVGESFVELDYNRQLEWIAQQGIDTSAMTQQQILEYQTGTWVFIRCGGRLVDAMEDFNILFNNL